MNACINKSTRNIAYLHLSANFIIGHARINICSQLIIFVVTRVIALRLLCDCFQMKQSKGVFNLNKILIRWAIVFFEEYNIEDANNLHNIGVHAFDI